MGVLVRMNRNVKVLLSEVGFRAANRREPWCTDNEGANNSVIFPLVICLLIPPPLLLEGLAHQFFFFFFPILLLRMCSWSSCDRYRQDRSLHPIRSFVKRLVTQAANRQETAPVWDKSNENESLDESETCGQQFSNWRKPDLAKRKMCFFLCVCVKELNWISL